MRKDYCDISVLLDRSGSMSSIKDDMEGGFNAFVEEQKKVPGLCRLSLYQFDDVFEKIYSGKLLKNTPPLELKPRNSTALYDAMAKCINMTGERFQNMNEEDRPEKVIVYIITDGLENSSREYSSYQIKQMVEHQTNLYNWSFVFLGANQDSVLTARTLGIGSGNALTYASNSVGTRSTYSSMGNNLTKIRMGSKSIKANFFENEDLEEQKKAGVK